MYASIFWRGFVDFYFVINVKNKEFTEAFGIYLCVLRKKAGLTQVELANDADIPLSQVGRIERGEVNTTISTVFAIAKALNLEVSELFNFNI